MLKHGYFQTVCEETLPGFLGLKISPVRRSSEVRQASSPELHCAFLDAIGSYKLRVKLNRAYQHPA